MKPVVLGFIALLSMAACGAGAYPVNYLCAELGASISTNAQLNGNDRVESLLGNKIFGGRGFAFAKVHQRQVFTVDLGKERVFDRIEFGTGNAGGDRNTDWIRIEVSNNGPDGPYRQVFEKKGLGLIQILRLPLVRARWVRFDLGEGSQGALVRGVRIFKSYEHPKLREVTKLLYERISPGLPGLKKFYAAAKKGDWERACSELRAYYNKTQPPDKKNPKYDLSRARAMASGILDYAGLVRKEVVPIDWSYQPTTDWYEHKNFLNRGARIGVMVDAYWNTGLKKWLEEAKSVFYDWIDANPKPTVMSGADYPTWRTLDSAARSGWLTSRFPEVTAARGLDDEFWANWLFSIWEHADYLKNDNFTGGNWLAHSTSAVMGIALQFPEFADRKIWLAYGKGAFELNVTRDIHPDGKEMEDAPGYVCFAFNGMLSTLKSLDEAGVPVSPEVRERLNKVQDFLGAVTQPDGNMPAIGDWGGGPPYPLPNSAEFFKRDDIKYILSKGKEGKKPAQASVNFPYGQWTIMRSDYEERPYENARHLVFKTSSGSHGHHDVLNITNYAYGRALLIDPGIRSYEHADVERYTHSSYHNTITVDGQNQSRGGGKTERWATNEGMDYVLGSAKVYKGLDIRRSIVFVKPDYWVLHDDIQGEGNHTYDQNWHFAEDAGLTEDPATKSVHTSYPEGGNLLMIPVDKDALKSEPKEFFIAKSRMGEGGPDNVPSIGWRYSKEGPTPQFFDLVLYPYSGPKVPRVQVRRLEVQDSGPLDVTALEIRVETNTDYVLVSRSGVRQFSIPQAGISAEGEVIVLRTGSDGAVRLFGENLKRVVFQGKELFPE